MENSEIYFKYPKIKITISLDFQVNDSMSPLFGASVNASESKVTEFPSGILGGDASNATKTQPITPQPSSKNAPSQPSSSVAAPSTTTTSAPIMMH